MGDLLTARKNWNTQQEKKKEKEVKEQAEKKRNSNGSTGALAFNGFVSSLPPTHTWHVKNLVL